MTHNNNNNKSDYNKPFMDLLKYLPEPYQSNANESLISNLFNRFLSKQEVDKVAGYIGKGNPNAIISRQIPENDVHRQAFQLQPILNNKIGSVEHMASWKDIQNELVRLGVDMDDYNKWGAVQKFNWVPPIDINKLVNFNDYYWVADDNSPPQYITVRSRCATATAAKNFWEDIIRQYGATFPIGDILPENPSNIENFDIERILPTSSIIKVTGDITTSVKVNDFFDVTDTVLYDGKYQITTIPIYDGINNATTLVVSGLVGVTNEFAGTLSTRRFNQIVFTANNTITNGDFTSLMEPGFILFLIVPTNNELNNTFIKVLGSSYDPDELTTTIQIDEVVTDDTFTVDALGSLNEQLSVFTASFNCQCGVIGGFDDGILWDDNPESPLWGDSEGAAGSPVPDGISDHQNLLDRITNQVPPTVNGFESELWYDQPSEILYQYSTEFGWKIIWNNFNLLLEATSGTALWDLPPVCDKSIRIPAIDQWVVENKWRHKNDITNFAAVTRANQPIIEYDWDLELNEWTHTNYNWSYRSGDILAFSETTLNPPCIELEPIDWWEQDGTTTTLDVRYGDLTDYFVNGKRIYIKGTLAGNDIIEIFEVDYSEYKTVVTNEQYRTRIVFKESPNNSTGDLTNLIPNSFIIYPFETINGDTWKGYGVHWLLRGVDDATPIPHQEANPFTTIDLNAPFVVTSNGYDTRKTFYAQEYSVTNIGSPIGVSYFELDSDVLPNDTRTLRRKSLFGFDDIKVYGSDIAGENIVRQFGSYDEVEEAVLDVIGIDYNTNEFLVEDDYAQYFQGGSPSGDVVVLTNNDSVVPSEYNVVSASGNRIKVLEPLTNISITGQLHNKTLPLSSFHRPTSTFTPTQYVTLYVMGINFINPVVAGFNILIEVGPSTIAELGSTFNRIRMIEDDEVYAINGNAAVSQTINRKVEQIKTRQTQYPLFDIFTNTGEPTFTANPIFGYRTDSTYDINLSTGLRIVVDPISNEYEFDQFLLENDNTELFAYRDYGSPREDFWYNPETQTVNFWKGTEWSDKTKMDAFFQRAVVSPIEPSPRELLINGLYWYDTTTNILFRRFVPIVGVPTWLEIETVDVVTTDKNLRTIWRAGIDNDLYTPEKVDWARRSESEYNTIRDDFVTTRTEELLINDPSLTLPEAIAQATKEWHDSEANPLSPTGIWIGDWEIPEPLYYNHLHENRKFLSSRELLTHFKTIIAEQPRIPGYTGNPEGMFALLSLADVNYSLGGTIKEFNDGFDTLLSSTFVNNVTPRSLISFAHNQYETLLNSLKEIYHKNAIILLTNIETDNILNLSDFIANEVISQYEMNDQAAFIYGDTTTFTDVDGVDDKGVRNWIATLPYVNLLSKHYPSRIIDDVLGINEVVHHDGHRNSYELSPATADIISQIVIDVPDPRNLDSNMGRASSNLPPNNTTEFFAEFNSSISNKEGVYWYYLQQTDSNLLYRYVVAESGTITPSDAYADGTLWMDLTPTLEVLRIKNTDNNSVVTWPVVDGLVQGDARLHNGSNPADLTTSTVSAWQVVDLNILLGDTVFTLETRLYDNVPTFPALAYDFTALPILDSVKYNEYLEEAFLDYISKLEISTPFKNVKFESTDPFTWNYKRSAHDGPLNIISADGLTNSFLISGNHITTFDPCIDSAPGFTACPSIVTFFIKNSGVNDGTWSTLASTSIIPTTFYDVGDDTTRIYVTGDVLDSLQGAIFLGTLPSPKGTNTLSNLNDGSESGGDWRDLYTKFYNSPYPNNEPWKLQGYTDKPLWWDDEYLNNNVDQWGKRKWKYKHGFEVIGAVDDVEDSAGVISINGNFIDLFISNTPLPIDNTVDHVSGYVIGNHATILNVFTGAAGTASIIVDDTNHTGVDTYFPGNIFTVAGMTGSPGTFTLSKNYNIVNITHSGNELTIIVAEEILAGDISVGTFINGVMYNPSTNATTIKLTSPVDNNNATGRVVMVFGMWENIRLGNIPPGREYPNGILGVTGVPSLDNTSGLGVPNLPIFNYFSVNIGNSVVSADGGTTNYQPDSVLPPFWDYINAFTSNPEMIDVPIRSLYFDFSTEIISPSADYIFGDSGDVEWEWKTSSQYLYDHLTVAYRIDPTRYVSSTFGFDYTIINNLQIDREVKNTPSHTRTNFHGDVVNDKPFISNGLNQWYINFNRYGGYDANFSDFKELWTGWKAPLTYQFASFVDTPSLGVDHRYVDITNFDYSVKSKRAPGVDDFWMDVFKIAIVNIPYNIAQYDNQIDWRFELTTNIPISRDIKYYDVHNYQFYANPTTDECWLYSWQILDLSIPDKTFTVAGDQTQVFATGSQFSIIGSSGNDAVYDVSTTVYNLSLNRTTILVDNNILSSTTDGIIKADYRKLPWQTGDVIYLSTSETLPIPLLGDTVNGLTKYFIIVYSDTTFGIAETLQDAQQGIVIDITTSGRSDQFVGEVVSTFNVVNSSTNWRFYALDKNSILEYNTPHEVQGMQNLVNIITGYDVYKEDDGWVINSDKQQLDPDTSNIIDWQLETERFISYAYSQRLIREQVNDRYPVTLDGNTSIWDFATDNRTFITGDPVTVLSSNGVYPTPLSRNIRYYIIRDALETFRLAASKQDAENAIPISITSTVGVGDLQVSLPREFRTLIPAFELNPFRNAVWFQPPRGIVSDVLLGPNEDIRSNQLIFNQNGDKINEDQLRVYRQDKETKISVVNATGNAEPTLLSIISPEFALLHLGGLHVFIDAYEHVMVMNNYTAGGNLLYDPFIGLNVTKFEMLFNKQVDFSHRPNVGGYYLETFFNQGASIRDNFESSVENLRNAYDTFETFETNLMTEYSRRGLGYEGTTDYLSNLNLSRKSQFIFWRGQIQNKGSVNAVKAFINSRRFVDAKIDDFWAIKVGEFGSIGEKEFPEMFVTTVDARSNELRLEFIDSAANETLVENSFIPIKMSDTERWYNQPDQTKVLRDNGKIMYFDTKAKNKAVFTVSGSPNDLIDNKYIRHDLDCDSVEITQSVAGVVNILVEMEDYKIINNNIIEFISGVGSPLPSTQDITIWGLVVNQDAQSPARIIDRDSETQISPIQFWDPARGEHYTNAIHNIDLQHRGENVNTDDPAEYTDTLRTVLYSGNWSEAKVGTTWLNARKLDYLPYFSEQMIPDITERLRSWGQLAEWAEYEIFEWVKSDVPPVEWDVLATSEEGDRTIPEHLRKSGIARHILLERDPSTGSPGDWIPATDKFVEQYTATDAMENPSNFTFTIPLVNFKSTNSPAQYLVNVYINGKLFLADVDVSTGTYSINKADITVSDIVRFVQFLPTTQEEIDVEVEAGNLLQDYEFTKVDLFNDLGISIPTYYFWVSQKRTKPTGLNRTMPIAEAVLQLNTIPAPHIFFQNVVPASQVDTEDENVLRSEITISTGGAQGIVLDLEMDESSSLLVEVNGVDQPNDGVVYTVGCSPYDVTLTGNVYTFDVNAGTVPITAGDVIKITYSGVFNKPIDLPSRFTQAIIRGLQGVVNADRRYTLRFNRNFTLRDNIDIENVKINTQDIKNKHEEWKIFRQEQQHNIDRWQWDRITESIISFKLTDPLVRVPSFERELYDEKFNTDTQYGLEDGQTFVNGQLALNSIVSYLLDPDVDFNPIDINTFFINNSFDTTESIIKAMDEIYNTFIFTNINRMYFSVLHDAFTTKAKYPGLFKTSMVSLHGIRPFQTGAFDD